MTSTITAGNGAGASSPTLILGYETSRANRNRIVDLVGGGIAAVLVAPRPRSGELELFYETEADAWASFALHGEETTFELVDTEIPAIGMTYVVNGDIGLALDEETRRRWVVTVRYQEVFA